MSRDGGTRTLARLALPSEIRFIDLVHATAEEVAVSLGLEEREALDLALAVREAAVNAMKHGNGLDPLKEVELHFAESPEGLVVTVLDQGGGFDPKVRPDPREEENLLRTSGRGIQMIEHLVDRVSYRYAEGKGMEITLVKRLGRAAEVAAGGPGDGVPRARPGRRT